MLWLLITSASLTALVVFVILKLFHVSKDTKLKKHDSFVFSSWAEECSPQRIPGHYYNALGNSPDLRQRQHHNGISLDLSNLPRPQGLQSAQTTERRNNINFAEPSYSSPNAKWQILNTSPEISPTSHWDSMASKFSCDDMPEIAINIHSLDAEINILGKSALFNSTSDSVPIINAPNVVNNASNSNINTIDNSYPEPKGLGLRGTKPLKTINLLDVLNPPQPNANRRSGQRESDDTSISGKTTPRKVPSPRENQDVGYPITLVKLQDLKIDKVIGGGGFGQVWRGSWNGTPVAVKILNPVCQNKVPENVLSEFEDEVKMLARLRHPNICMFLGACLEPPTRAIFTELVTRGTLWELLRTPGLFAEPRYQNSAMFPPFHWPLWVTKRTLEGTLRGLIYLHNQGIIHRDLKSANLLLDDCFNVKICDFGLARLKDFTTVMTANVGTIQWMSPEVISGKAYDEFADIYSVGVVMWEIFTGTCPFEGMSQLEIAMNVSKAGLRLTIPDSCNSAQANLLNSCWNIPSLRPSSSEVLQALDEVFPSIYQ